MKNLLLVSLFALGCRTSSVPVAGTPPELFSFSQGHAYLGSETVQWNGDELEVLLNTRGEEERHFVSPSPDDWKHFWARLDELDVWRWKESYTDPEKSGPDGAAWSLEIHHGDRELSSRGYNVFPEAYPELLRAVETVLEMNLSPYARER